MASWNSGEAGNRGSYQQNYPYQNYYDERNYDRSHYYMPNNYQYQGTQWCNSVPPVNPNVVFFPTNYNPPEEFIPSYVCHNTNSFDTGGDCSTVNNTRAFGGGGAVPKQNYNQRRPNAGANRLYRNPHVNQNNTYRPSGHPSSSDGPKRPGGSGESSKADDKKKLLAEVATLLNQDRKEGRGGWQQQWGGGGRNSKGWAATPNQKQPKNTRSERRDTQRYDLRKDQDGHRYDPRKEAEGQQRYDPRKDVEALRYDARKEAEGQQRYDPRKDVEALRYDVRKEAEGQRERLVKEPQGQRERLVDQLTKGKLECLVCCERLKQMEAVWSCQKCYHVLHLECTSKWALASTNKVEGARTTHDVAWRCPACQHVYQVLPSRYTCFCGKVNCPKWIKGETPHCCGEPCGKKKGCHHPCTLLCHPGPCPPCTAVVQRECGCGRTKQSVKCSSSLSLQCDLLCGKMLECGRHDCLESCHQGPCPPCSHKQHQKCYCGKEERETGCGGSTEYSCAGVCGQELDCGLHRCEEACHPGACPPCPADLTAITTCHCGTKAAPRTSCAEPVPSCGGPCPLVRPTCPHPCIKVCHPKPCPPCKILVISSCQCGHNTQAEATCHDITHGNLPKCKKKCTKKRNCGKHKCNQECCNDSAHICTIPCNKTLTCGQHKCPELCHTGNCAPCPRLSFEELTCECGQTVIYPPVECGRRLPECKGPCLRDHSCPHPPTHNCHGEPSCPPCTVLVSRTCYGSHETRKAVPCYIAEYSCGLPCNKVLPCSHRCVERCHGGDCPTECHQPCAMARTSCNHPCNLPCHSGKECGAQPPCQFKLKVLCQCGRRSQFTTCSEYSRTWARQLAAEQASNNQNILIDTTKINLKVLECDSECKLYERNLKLAIGLQIVNPDLSSKLKPQYSENMRSWAKKDPRFCDMVFHKLTQLVTLAKDSKQKSRSYSFDIMSAPKRQFIHEYCKHFGCESVAYDAEPKRNVVATAYRDKCWLPSYSLLEVIQRENGQRKVPMPNLNRAPSNSDKEGSLKETHDMVPLSSLTKTPRATSPPPIDYFDFTPTS